MIAIQELAALTEGERARLLRRSGGHIDDLADAVRPIVAAVRDEGDAAVSRFTQEFDGIAVSPGELRVSVAEIEEAGRDLDPRVAAAIESAVARVRAFHQRQLPPEMWFAEVSPGVLLGEKVTPITSVGLYVPRGKGAFPSVAFMLAVPAAIAGVPRVVICTPPGPGGRVDPATLFTARLCGVHEVYRAGGAQGIAALAYGTESLPPVRKIMGPGSGYVVAAKRLLYGTVDVGIPAGPSEAILLADGAADPELVARDLLVEAEHGPDSSSLLVTDSRSLAEAVAALLPSKIDALPEPRRGFCAAVLGSDQKPASGPGGGIGGVLLTPDMDSAVEFVNLFAPEHLEVLVARPFELLPRLKNAGEILLGPHTPIPVGNFSAGTNAILPTGGFAHTFSCTSVHDFIKRTGVAQLSAAGYAGVEETTRRLAEFEGFPAHAAAVTGRLVRE